MLDFPEAYCCRKVTGGLAAGGRWADACRTATRKINACRTTKENEKEV